MANLVHGVQPARSDHHDRDRAGGERAARRLEEVLADLDRGDVLEDLVRRKLAAEIRREPTGPAGRVLAPIADEDARQRSLSLEKVASRVGIASAPWCLDAECI